MHSILAARKKMYELHLRNKELVCRPITGPSVHGTEKGGYFVRQAVPMTTTRLKLKRQERVLKVPTDPIASITQREFPLMSSVDNWVTRA